MGKGRVRLFQRTLPSRKKDRSINLDKSIYEIKLYKLVIRLMYLEKWGQTNSLSFGANRNEFHYQHCRHDFPNWPGFPGKWNYGRLIVRRVDRNVGCGDALYILTNHTKGNSTS